MFNNNGFKKIVKDIIEARCKENNLSVSVIDVSKQEKIFYIFDKDWFCKATIKAYFMEKEISLAASTDVSKLVGIGNETHKERCSYLNFCEIDQEIDNIFDTIKEKIEDEE